MSQMQQVMRMPWICDCQSARTRALADGSFTAIVPGAECQWCGRTWWQASLDAAARQAADKGTP